MTHLTYLEASVVGLVQGVSELFPFPVSGTTC
jgi:undecaprenyl pyrophosphate phosphatase UppP